MRAHALLNSTGAFLSPQAAAHQMIKAGTGDSILLIVSIAAHRTNYTQPQAAYDASKVAPFSQKSSLAVGCAVYGICVSPISPGYRDNISNEGNAKKKSGRHGLRGRQVVWKL